MKELLQKAESIIQKAKTLWIRDGKLQWSPELVEAALYIMDGGKGARPALLLWSMEATARVESPDAADEKLEATCLESALALEMIHVYSLVHDDLPSMDNDDYRRGKLTLHKKHSEAFAVLTGDALLTGAFEVLTHAVTSDRARVLLLRELAFAAGGAGMIAGQVWDIEAEKSGNMDLDLWTRIHDAKTGALFGAALSMGFILGSDNIADADVVDARNWGIRLGRLFQIVDDKLDKGPFYKKLGEEALAKLCQREAQELKSKAESIWGNPTGLTEILDFL
ncbi:MAG: polyprenyl synthetase family protein [Bdellovibrionota bacterium]